MEKPMVAYRYNRIVHIKKKWITHTHHVDEIQKHYIYWKRSGKKENRSYDSIYVKFKINQN